MVCWSLAGHKQGTLHAVAQLSFVAIKTVMAAGTSGKGHTAFCWLSIQLLASGMFSE